MSRLREKRERERERIGGAGQLQRAGAERLRFFEIRVIEMN